MKAISNLKNLGFSNAEIVKELYNLMYNGEISIFDLRESLQEIQKVINF